MNEIFMEIVGAIITILVALITGFVIPWLKTKISNENLDKITYYTEMAVRCAEQLYTPEQWREKKAYVLNYIRELANGTFGVNLSDQDIDVLIEGAVNSVKEKL